MAQASIPTTGARLPAFRRDVTGGCYRVREHTSALDAGERAG